MKNVFFTLAFMLVGTFAFANTEVTPDIEMNKTANFLSNDIQEEFFGCTFTRTTTTTTNPDGSSSTTTTDKVTCDTPRELATYIKEISKE